MEKGFDWKEYFDGLKDKDGNTINIPVTGSLGLLAQGDLAVIAWKQRRDSFLQKRKAEIIQIKKDQKNE